MSRLWTSYEYNIANQRTTRTNADGTGMRQAQYGVNGLNQYTNREVPGFIEVSGTATGTVSVNGQPPTWQGNYFRNELAVDNSADSVFTNITVIASDATSTSLVARTSFVPRSPEVFAYDLDGNLTQDGQWGYTWDAENRLTRMELLTNAVPAEHRLQLSFTYDWQGRRIAKLVKQWNPEDGTYQITSFRKFHYDGWNLICEQDEVTGMKISYTWGLDLSQSLQVAGGVGGLLWITVQAGPLAGTYSVHYDGNGNVIGLVNATDGSVAAHYEYEPFGELLRATGPLAGLMPFRFSTKYQDVETGLVYYGYRYYRVDTGRWISRDPIGEAGGLNVYGLVFNDPLSFCDPYGLALYAFDGTNNDKDRDRLDNPNAPNDLSNVAILADLYNGNVHYRNGVGTRDEWWNSLGLASGFGGRSRIDLMVLDAELEFANKDYEVDIVGFSRGAAMAREFAHRLHDLSPCFKIRWLGLFDTVASFGLGGNDVDLGYRLGLPDNVQRAFHIVAVHEQRYFFPLASIKTGSTGTALSKNFEEVLMPGVHSDIGGGYREHRGLANAALIRMHTDGVAHGVPFYPIPAEYLDTSTKAIHADNVWWNDLHPLYGLNPFWKPGRTIYYHP